jgi:uncharacterized protein YndB with AHSA1/START domain
MRLRDGAEVHNEGCFLLADPERQLVFTDAIQSGFRLAASAFMTCDLRPMPWATAPLYACHVMHPTAEHRVRHEEMGFFDGCGPTLKQRDRLACTL